LAALFSITLFLSSALLFLVQPLCGKMLLPSLGGSPAVWNTCILFFQAALLIGYAYVHAASRHLRVHALVHLLLFAAGLWFLPIAFDVSNPSDTQPVFWLLWVLLCGVGLPFFVLSANAPLLQTWFAVGTHPHREDPYFLYAASNLGSLIALLCYPFVIEPNLSLDQQRLYWKWGFALALTLAAVCAVMLWRGRQAAPTGAADPVILISWWTRLRWLVLAFVPSSLMLSVTMYLTTDIAAVPLLWVVPLAIYLLTFVIAFAGRSPPYHQTCLRWAPLVVLVLVLVMLLEARQPMLVIVGLHLFGLFWLALVCHGELARTRPPAERLTAFYFWLAVGGLLGGVFNALLAPLVFNRVAEYPLMLVAVCLLLPVTGRRSVAVDVACAAGLGLITAALIWVVQSEKLLPPGQLSVAVVFAPALLIAYLMHAHPHRYGLAMGAILLASLLYHGVHGRDDYVQRSFFGVHRVTQDADFRYLIHGNTQHGQQSLDPAERRTPLMYYFPTGPIGQLVAALKDDGRLDRVGLVGLGCGALAAYSKAGQHWSFFEIDPAVIHIARDAGWFTYLADAPGRCDVQLGDGRLLLRKSKERFGLLVIDAFSSDSIPLHLLTREAMQVYRDHLLEPTAGKDSRSGVIAFHISNHYLHLEPVLARLAQDAGPEWICLIQNDTDPDPIDKARGKAASQWVLMTRDRRLADALLADGKWTAATTDPALRVWTDDYSNLFRVFRWGE